MKTTTAVTAYTYLLFLIIAFTFKAGTAWGYVYSKYEDTLGSNASSKGTTVSTKRKSRLPEPDLPAIPKSELVMPDKADEVPPSRELLEIINKVKKQPLRTPDKSKRGRDDTKVSKSSLEIIKKKEEAVKAAEVAPSPALKAVLNAYRNGTLAYAQRTFNPEDENESVFYHQPYTEVDLQSVFDMTVLTSGNDIFLSLGLTPLEQNSRTEEDNRSRKIKELKQVVLAFKIKDARKASAMSPDQAEIDRLKATGKTTIQPRKLMLKQLMDFFGIKRRGNAGQTYEEMSSAFRLYKQWVNRWERMDMYVKKKKNQRIQLNRYRKAGSYEKGETPSIKTKGSGFKQMPINKYGYEKIYLPNK